jgi:uncharacterized protein (TIGR00730 family)
MTRYVAIYCASNADDVPAFVEGTEDLVDALAERGLGVVYGGARVGLMGVVARRALARGVPVLGVIPRRLLDRELLMPGLTGTEIVDTMAERKALMAREASAFVALPGAIGTLDEILEEWTTRHLGIHDKPLGFHDVDGYWAPFFDALRTMHARGVVRDAHLAIPAIHRDARTLLDAMGLGA